jgi:hypothetical protein
VKQSEETHSCFLAQRPKIHHESGSIHANLPSMPRPPDRKLIAYLAPYDPHVSNLALALRNIVLEEAPEAIESLVNGYAVAIGFSFTGKPLKDGFCHVVTYADHVNLGFNRGAQLADPDGVLEGSGKSIRHIRIRNHDDLDRPLVRRFLRAAIAQVARPAVPLAAAKPKKKSPATKG